MRPLLLLLLVPATILYSSIVFAGELRVTPVTLIFDKQFKNGIITVINEGTESIQVEIKAAEWTQDSSGKDQYKDTTDLIFFPKILTIEKGENRAVRAGIKTPAISSEKTYRLFIKELPKATKEIQGAQVRFAMQFAVPIFVKPVKEEIKGEVINLKLGNGQFAFDVRNSGNSHFRIDTIVVKGLDATGAETYSKELNGWYLLPGAMRTYSTPISQENCQDASKFVVEVKSDQLSLHGQLDVIKTLCLP